MDGPVQAFGAGCLAFFVAVLEEEKVNVLRMLLMIMRRTLALAVKAAWGPEQLEYVSQAIFDVGKTVTRQKIVLKDEDEREIR